MRTKLKVSKTSSSQKPKKTPFVLRLLPVALTTFIGVAIAVYCVSWYFQASIARQAVERMIADINSKQQVISYSSIDTSGFPMDVSVRIMQPKFSISMDPSSPGARDGQAADGSQPEWIEEFFLHGSLSLSVNVFSDRFTATILGPITQTSVINQVRTSMETQPGGPLACSLQLDRPTAFLGSLWDMEWLSRTSTDDVVRDFRSVECSVPGYAMTEASSREPMLNSGPLLLHFATPARRGNTRGMEFAIRLTDLEFSPRMNNVLNNHIAAMYGSGANLPNIDMAAYGKQNVDIAMYLHGPADMKAFSDDTPFVVSIPRFNITNALYSSLSNAQVENRVNGNNRTINMIFNSDSSFSKSYDKYLSDYARILVARIKSSKDMDLAEIKNSMAAMTTEQSGELLDPLIPKLHSFGNISMHVNAILDGDKVLRKGKLTVNSLDVSTTPYGFNLQGSAALPDSQGSKSLDNANFTLACRNCLMLVDDASHYVQRLQKSLTSLDRELAGTPPYLSQQMAQSIQTFLTTVGEKRREQSGAETLVFNLATDKAGYLSLNGKSPQQIHQLYNAIIVPSLPNYAASPVSPVSAQAQEEKIPPGGY